MRALKADERKFVESAITILLGIEDDFSLLGGFSEENETLSEVIKMLEDRLSKAGD